MEMKLIKCFLKDQRGYCYAYFISNFLIGLFYYMTFHEKIEVIYPLSISFFIYLVLMLYKFYEYYRFWQGLDDMLYSNDYQGNYYLESDKKVNTIINRLHNNYLDRLNTSNMDKKKERRFLSLWIHNMKTPITVTDLLLQRMEQDEINAQDGIKEIKSENEKLLGNLDAILNMIRLEEFAKDYIPEKIDLLNELNSIINKNKKLFIYNKVFPKVLTDLQDAFILSDKKWNELMINQIISNAVKYSKEDGVSKNITFFIERVNNEIILTIKDEGIGIPEYDISKLYEPFFTGDNGRKGYQSSGIGLYFCSEVCKLLGHSLQISSEVAKGTSVKISYLAKL